MNKQNFLEITRDLTQFSKENISELRVLQRAYPYSQILHALVAKIQKEAHEPEAGLSLNLAAMYATDRGLLKELMQTPVKHKPAKKKKSPKPKADPLPVPEVMVHHEADPNDEMEMIRNELLSNLESLQRHRKMYLDHEYPPLDGKRMSAKKSAAMVETLEEKEELLTKDKPLKQNQSGPSVEEKKNLEVKKDQPEILNRKEQIKIINKFIKSEPSLAIKAQEKPDKIPQDDLSSNSTEFGEDLVSENLAHILINQGKKKKAIDIYKKLIWKFPQKKAYFAAQIEALKN